MVLIVPEINFPYEVLADVKNNSSNNPPTHRSAYVFKKLGFL